MTRHIEVVAGAFVIMEDREVIGVVTKINDTQWGFYPLVSGTPSRLMEGMKFNRS